MFNIDSNRKTEHGITNLGLKYTRFCNITAAMNIQNGAIPFIPYRIICMKKPDSFISSLATSASASAAMGPRVMNILTPQSGTAVS